MVRGVDGALLLVEHLALLAVEVGHPLCLGALGEEQLAPAQRKVKLERAGFAKCGGGWTRWPVGSRAFAPSSSSSCVTNSQRTGFAEFATMKRLSETICSTFAAIARVLNSTSAVPRGRPPSSGGSSRSTTQRTMSPNCWNASRSSPSFATSLRSHTRSVAVSSAQRTFSGTPGMFGAGVPLSAFFAAAACRLSHPHQPKPARHTVRRAEHLVLRDAAEALEY